MVDRLDEIFPRRSDVERTALRGLLRTLRYFGSASIRVKVFLRDDMLEQVVRSDQRLHCPDSRDSAAGRHPSLDPRSNPCNGCKAILRERDLVAYLKINRDQLDASASYRTECFEEYFLPLFSGGPSRALQFVGFATVVLTGAGCNSARCPRSANSREAKAAGHILRPTQTAHRIGSLVPQQFSTDLRNCQSAKRQTYLQAEFPHFGKTLRSFQAARLTTAQLLLRAFLVRVGKHR